jgi:hypothetical protein
MRDTDPGLTKRQREYVDTVIEACNATKYRRIDPGVACQCETCQSAFGLSEDELLEGSENGSVHDEGGFSWHGCEVCRSSLGGTRYAAHGFAEDGSVLHYDVCADCLCYLANGDVPERPYE